MTTARDHRRRGAPLGVAAATLLLLPAPVTEAAAQVRRGEGRPAAAAATRPGMASPQTGRIATGQARIGSGNVQGSGNRLGGNVQGSGNRLGGNVQGSGNRLGGNVNIGNDINVVRPPAAGRPPGYYPGGYRPPPVVAVPVYPGYAGPSAGTVIAAGVVAGATAGLVAGAVQGPSTTTVVTTAPPPGGMPLEPGMQLAALPGGCGTQQVGPTVYYRCGTAWVRSVMQGSQVVYLVVPPP